MSADSMHEKMAGLLDAYVRSFDIDENYIPVEGEHTPEAYAAIVAFHLAEIEAAEDRVRDANDLERMNDSCDSCGI